MENFQDFRILAKNALFLHTACALMLLCFTKSHEKINRKNNFFTFSTGKKKGHDFAMQ